LAVAALGGTLLTLSATRQTDRVKAKPVVFRYAFESGQTRRYTLSMNIKLGPHDADGVRPVERNIHAELRTTVAERRADGSTVMDLVVDHVITEPASHAPVESGRLRVVLAGDGRLLDVRGTGGVFTAAGVDPTAFGKGPRTGLDSQLLFPRFPARAVAPGDTWSSTATVPLPYGNAKTTVRADGRLVGYETSSFGPAARIAYIVRTPLDVELTVADLVRAAVRNGADPPQPVAPAQARIALAGQTVTNAQALVLTGTSELVRLVGTTTMSVRMGINGVPPELFEGATPDEYSLEAAITTTIVRIPAS
jgi:hypothetical protein